MSIRDTGGRNWRRASIIRRASSRGREARNARAGDALHAEATVEGERTAAATSPEVQGRCTSTRREPAGNGEDRPEEGEGQAEPRTVRLETRTSEVSDVRLTPPRYDAPARALREGWQTDVVCIDEDDCDTMDVSEEPAWTCLLYTSPSPRD